MIRLFSSFDLNYNRSLVLCIFMIIFFSFVSVSKIRVMSSGIKSVTAFLSSFFSRLNNKRIRKIFLIFIFSTIFLILNFNFVSIIPFGAALSTQLGGVLFLALAIWFSMVLFSSINSTKGFLSHLIPLGTPNLLIPFIFVIELVRLTVRPITLTVRLVANILAGHLLICLLFNLCNSIKLSFVFYVILNLVELGVGVIQSYILVTLIRIYFSEI